jgi:transposase-like protein
VKFFLPMSPYRVSHEIEGLCVTSFVRAGIEDNSASTCREFEPTAQTIHRWVLRAARDAGMHHGGLTTTEREELTRVRRENRRLEFERETQKPRRVLPLP